MRRVVTASRDRTIRVWNVPSVPLPIPKWFLELVEAVCGERINQPGVLELDPVVELMRLKRQVAERPAADYYSRWAQWFFADRATRTISPNSSITTSEHVKRRIQENTLESLQETVRLSPTNGLAFARLAKQVLAQNDEDNPRREDEAAPFARLPLGTLLSAVGWTRRIEHRHVQTVDILWSEQGCEAYFGRLTGA